MPPISLEPLISQEILNPVLNLGGQQQIENKLLFSMTTKGKIEDANEGKCSWWTLQHNGLLIEAITIE